MHRFNFVLRKSLALHLKDKLAAYTTQAHKPDRVIVIPRFTMLFAIEGRWQLVLLDGVKNAEVWPYP